VERGRKWENLSSVVRFELLFWDSPERLPSFLFFWGFPVLAPILVP